MLAAAFGLAASSVHFHTVGAMIVPLEQEMGWSRAAISTSLLIASTLLVFAAFAAGVLADRVGARRVGIVGISLYALSLAGIGMSGPSITSWYVAWGVMAVANGFATGVIWTMAIVSRFEKHRGLALALTLSGTGLTVAGVPVFSLYFTESWGWRSAYFGLCAVILVGVVPLLLAFFRDSHDLARHSSASSPSVPVGGSKPGLSVHTAIRGRQLWQIAVSFFLLGVGIGSMIVHLQPMLIESGMTATTAAVIASSIGPALVISRLLTGVLLDRFSTVLIAGSVALFPAICCVTVLNFDGSIMMATTAALLIGAALGTEVDVMAFVVSRYMGPKNYGALFGLVSGIFGISVGFAPVLAGAAYDNLGSYSSMLWVNVFCSLLASIMLFTLGRACGMSEYHDKCYQW